jgi:predicted DNA binding CopG/RHH family protein
LKKKYKPQEIENMIESVEPANLSPEEEKEFDKMIELAEKEIEAKRQSVNVNFRWTADEIERAKKIAEKKGMPYQTYLKSTLKQQMDKDEKDLGIAS